MHSKQCKNCQATFIVRPEDTEFYNKMQVPEPTYCPSCRRQRRLSFRNERFFFKRKCDKCQKSIISTYHEKAPYTVYCYDCWWSADLEGLDYGQDFDFTRPFFEQFNELSQKIPHLAIFKDPLSEDCEYTNFGQQNKSCYLAQCFKSEHIYYTHGAFFSKSCLDSNSIDQCELCCECVDCNTCYKLAYSQDSLNCQDSYFLDNCQNCKNCFICSGQNNKEYMVMNQQLSKEQYEEYMKKIELNYPMVIACYQKLKELSLTTPKKYTHQVNTENCTGDYIRNCKNCYNCFDCLAQLSDSAYSEYCGSESHSLYDCSYGGVQSAFNYESCASSRCNNVKFNFCSRPCSDSQYVQHCSGSNLFGCFRVHNKSYCIFNKQYSPEEYQVLSSKIVKHMQATGEYGEFFPIEYSDTPYNLSIAQEHFPLTKEKALTKGLTWLDKDPSEYQNLNPIPPKTIENIPKDINKEIFSCQICKKNYKIIQQELKLRQQIEVPLNPFCPECRYTQLFQKRNPRQLYSRSCTKCQTPIQTTYSPDKPDIIYCEKCYLESIY